MAPVMYSVRCAEVTCHSGIRDVAWLGAVLAAQAGIQAMTASVAMAAMKIRVGWPDFFLQRMATVKAFERAASGYEERTWRDSAMNTKWHP